MRKFSVIVLLITGLVPGLFAQNVSDPPAQPNPVQEFRRWLSLDADSREIALRGRTEQQRLVLRSKIQEYQNLPAQEREERLNVLELEFYLRPLMKLSGAAREPALAAVPAPFRKTVETRLQEWDRVPSDIQKEVLESQTAIHYFMRYDAARPEQQQIALKSFTPEVRKRLEEKVQQWEAMPFYRRQKISRHVENFLDLPASEQKKALLSFSPAERDEMEKTLSSFEKLSSAQRKQCVESFAKLAGMSSNDRKQFLRNAERWQAMSAHEREAWRGLVNALPPMPPDINPPPMPISPPLPAK